MEHFAQLDKLSEEGYLRRVVSPCGRLVLYNYSDKCVFDKKWNKYTLNARGTVYELSTGKVVAKAFPKFFNFSELPPSKSRNLAKKTDFSTSEKVDGSLGVVYFYDGDWQVNTRGSFNSDQAIEGFEILNSRLNYNLDHLDESVTYLVEIIYPENKIIVDYGSERKLVLLGAYYTPSGLEIHYDFVMETSNRVGMEIVKKYDFKSIDELIAVQERLPSTEEGFVVRFSSGERFKFKSLQYLKIARLLSHLTPLHLWEHMQQGIVNKQVLMELPEEFRPEIDAVVTQLQHEYNRLKEEILSESTRIIEETSSSDNQKKVIGLMQKDLQHGSCIFSILDGQQHKIDKYIMKHIRPKGNNLIISE